MRSFADTVRKHLNSSKRTNFSILRGGIKIGSAVAIPVGNRFIEVFSQTVDINAGDCLIGGNEIKYVITKTDINIQHTRLYFSESD